ncbi:hypothetical protein [Chelatococcus asaccharovorans]|uniref:Itaconyl-CoA hydratase n=1 Tax=Chelatococcus asaccharovorans TaxID=28210 RepID=A0A2V3UB55_9HYPH|nr:hypothetical protein [Chelatococcus asaccharovorans]MBS7705487.1 hypothetical protein [Chelatococcus asaccharovorans]PXW60108.1 itaconyl-CoA hydratase [Chelatococcus asaccharovorans]
MSCYGYLRVGPHRYRERFGLSYEDLSPGMRIRHRPAIDVTQRDNQLDSVDLINNAHLHYDSQYAARTEWGTPLTVSTMTVQRFMGMISRSWYRRRRILRIDNLALTAPVRGDDTLRSESEVIGVTDLGDRDVGQVQLRINGINRSGAIVARIDCHIELYRAGRHPEDQHGLPVCTDERFCLYHKDVDGVRTEQTGLWYEDLALDETYEHWPPRSLMAYESRQAALRSLEINPRWQDADYRERTGIADEIWEPFVLGAVTALTTRTFGRVVANLGWTDIELPAPVAPDETIRAESTVVGLRASRSRPDQGIATVDTQAYSGDRLVCSYRRNLLLYRRGQGPYAAAGY